MEGRLHPEVAFISTILARKADELWNKHGNGCGKQGALQSPARKKTYGFKQFLVDFKGEKSAFW